MRKHVVILVLMLLACFSGGCAVLPALVTTGASMAVPQTVSTAITVVGTVHKTALVAVDERDMDVMLSDKLVTLQAEAVLLAEPGVDMAATCLNGDLYLVGEYATLANRDSALEELARLKGVRSVKGVVKPMPTSLAALVEPAISDNHAETVIESGLLAELHIRSANVDVEVVQGEAVVTGVVRDAEEAESVVALVKTLRPESETPVKVTSLLVFQDAYEAARPQLNEVFALHTRQQVLMAAASRPLFLAETPLVGQVGDIHVSTEDLVAAYIPKRTPWQKSRLKMKRRILSIAKTESDPAARKELIILSTKVLKDKNTSIEDRLVRTLHGTSSLAVKRHVDSILVDIAPDRTERLSTLAMN